MPWWKRTAFGPWRNSYDFAYGDRTKQDKKAFATVLLDELQRLKDMVGVNTPKVGLYIHGYNNDWQASIDELVDMHAALSMNALGFYLCDVPTFPARPLR